MMFYTLMQRAMLRQLEQFQALQAQQSQFLAWQLQQWQVWQDLMLKSLLTQQQFWLPSQRFANAGFAPFTLPFIQYYVQFNRQSAPIADPTTSQPTNTNNQTTRPLRDVTPNVAAKAQSAQPANLTNTDKTPADKPLVPDALTHQVPEPHDPLPPQVDFPQPTPDTTAQPAPTTADKPVVKKTATKKPAAKKTTRETSPANTDTKADNKADAKSSIIVPDALTHQVPEPHDPVPPQVDFPQPTPDTKTANTEPSNQPLSQTALQTASQSKTQDNPRPAATTATDPGTNTDTNMDAVTVTITDKETVTAIHTEEADSVITEVIVKRPKTRRTKARAKNLTPTTNATDANDASRQPSDWVTPAKK